MIRLLFLSCIGVSISASASLPAQSCSHNPKEVVKKAYELYLNREPDPEGLTAYSNYLKSTNSVRMVMIGIAKSGEWQDKHGPDSTSKVKALYHMFLDRDADPSGLETYTGVLTGKGMEALLEDPNGFTWSKEANKFGQTLPGTETSWCEPSRPTQTIGVGVNHPPVLPVLSCSNLPSVRQSATVRRAHAWCEYGDFDGEFYPGDDPVLNQRLQCDIEKHHREKPQHRVIQQSCDMGMTNGKGCEQVH